MRVIRTSFIIVLCIVGALFLAYQGVNWMVQNAIREYDLDYSSIAEGTGRSIQVLINGDPNTYLGVKYIFMNNKWQMSIVTSSNKLQQLLKSTE